MGWGKQEARIMRHTKLSLVENTKCQDQIRATGKFKSNWVLSDSFVCAGKRYEIKLTSCTYFC